MDERACGVPEERWIDYRLGKLSPERAAELEAHRLTCRSCRETSSRWASWLELPPGGPAAREAGLRAERSGGGGIDWRRWRLRQRVRARGLRVRLARLAHRPDWRRRTYVWAAACVCAALVFGLWRYATDDGTEDIRTIAHAYAQRHAPEGAALLLSPDTVAYPVGVPIPAKAASGPPMSGVMWINGTTGEMFVLFDGLLPSELKDIQAWAVDRRQRINLGLLEYHERLSHLYARWGSLAPEGVEEVSFTIEPKGGSEQPTSPDRVVVRLAD